jgi:hypothetical protein
MLNQNCLRPNVLGSLSPSRGFAQTLKLFAMVLFCLVLLLGSKEDAFAQVVGGERYGKGTILEFKRFVNGVETQYFNPGDEIWVTAKASYHNDREIEQVSFGLIGSIKIDQPGLQNVYLEGDSALDVDPGGQGVLNVNKSENGGYVTPVNHCPPKYVAGAHVGSSINGVMEDPLDVIIASFVKN